MYLLTTFYCILFASNLLAIEQLEQQKSEDSVAQPTPQNKLIQVGAAVAESVVSAVFNTPDPKTESIKIAWNLFAPIIKNEAQHLSEKITQTIEDRKTKRQEAQKIANTKYRVLEFDPKTYVPEHLEITLNQIEKTWSLVEQRKRRQMRQGLQNAGIIYHPIYLVFLKEFLFSEKADGYTVPVDILAELEPLCFSINPLRERPLYIKESYLLDMFYGSNVLSLDYIQHYVKMRVDKGGSPLHSAPPTNTNQDAECFQQAFDTQYLQKLQEEHEFAWKKTYAPFGRVKPQLFGPMRRLNNIYAIDGKPIGCVVQKTNGVRINLLANHHITDNHSPESIRQFLELALKALPYAIEASPTELIVPFPERYWIWNPYDYDSNTGGKSDRYDYMVFSLAFDRQPGFSPIFYTCSFKHLKPYSLWYRDENSYYIHLRNLFALLYKWGFVDENNNPIGPWATLKNN